MAGATTADGASLLAASVVHLAAAAMVMVVARMVVADHTDQTGRAVVIGVALVRPLVVLVATSAEDEESCDHYW